MTEIVAAHLERVAKELTLESRAVYQAAYARDPDTKPVLERHRAACEATAILLAAALAACAREEALEWDKTAQLHISRWTELEWRNERLRALERAAGEKAGGEKP